MEGELFSISYTVQETTSESVLNHIIVSKVPVCFHEYEGTAHMTANRWVLWRNVIMCGFLWPRSPPKDLPSQNRQGKDNPHIPNSRDISVGRWPEGR